MYIVSDIMLTSATLCFASVLILPLLHFTRLGETLVPQYHPTGNFLSPYSITNIICTDEFQACQNQARTSFA